MGQPEEIRQVKLSAGGESLDPIVPTGKLFAVHDPGTSPFLPSTMPQAQRDSIRALTMWFGGRVEVVDSRTTTHALAMIATGAAGLAREGAGLAEVAGHAEALKRCLPFGL